MEKAIIYSENKNPMQSGINRAKTRGYNVLILPQNFNLTNNLYPWELYNATSKSLVNLHYFQTLELAIEFCKNKALDYKIITPQSKILRKKSYGDNFK
jgi:hypothetical protein